MTYAPPQQILERYASVLVDFALGGGEGVKAGEVVRVLAPESAKPLYAELHRAVWRAGAHTIAGYRDTMRLLLTFANTQTGKPPSKLEIDDLDAELITRFLDHLEHDRGNTARTRNVRLAAKCGGTVATVAGANPDCYAVKEHRGRLSHAPRARPAAGVRGSSGG